MACVGDYEIVSDTQNVVFNGLDSVSVSLDAPAGKHVLFGWVVDPAVQVLKSTPSSDGTAWEFTLRSFSAGTFAVQLAVSCAALG